jgi:hypothetical protein
MPLKTVDREASVPDQTAQQMALEWVKALVPAMTGIGAGLWVAYRYLADRREAHKQTLRQQRSEELTRALEARKPFLARQLELYFETAEVVGKLVTIDDWDSDEWKAKRARFAVLFWTALSLVEDDQVKKAMVEVRKQLRLVGELKRGRTPTAEGPIGSLDKEEEELRQTAYRLARSLKGSLQNSWRVDPGIVLRDRET